MTLREESKELGISASYLFDILHGYKGCSEELMLNIKHIHPELDFTLLNPRYKLRKASDKCNYMEYKELLQKYKIGANSIDWRNLTYNELDDLLNIILEGKDNE